MVNGGAGGASGVASGGAGGIGGLGYGGGGGSAVGGYGGGPRAGGQTMTAAGGIGGQPSGGIAGTVIGGGGGQNTGGVPVPTGGSFPGFGGMGGFPMGGTPGTGPIGGRPSDWTPPFTQPLGPPGWQQSTSPICDVSLGSGESFSAEAGFNVWADERGVFATFGAGCSTGYAPCDLNPASVQFNSGSGWQLFYEFAADSTSGPGRLSGFPGGPLLVGGFFDNKCRVAFLDENGLAFQTGPDGLCASAGFGVGKDAAGNDLAYAVGGTEAFRYSAGTWSTVGKGGSTLAATWTDGKIVVAAGGDQTVLMGTADGQLTPVAGVPAGGYGAVWGFGANDIWLGNGAGQLVHFDGSKWQAHDTGSRDLGGIQQLWGDSGVLYFSTSIEFGRWNGSSVEILLQPPADAAISKYPAAFGQFWGRSANDVFIPLRDSRYAYYTCGGAFVLWYDGSQFHSF